ncbi:sensor histidine kinase [Hymenobacter sp. APR13]|uniref:sensor histidine kinase n=1 Tax=Hymenobacter sp. APR13 TaxID=1356852 RepID=UPI0004E032EF|nr:histidine kinase [Hymenobacter sp. APR13]AII54358.1 hypothetical protein N008_20520 [Hymenobacter sp. APR13]
MELLSAAVPAPRARLTGRSLGLLAIFYLLFGLFYVLILAWGQEQLDLQLFRTYALRVLLLDYPLKALWTVPLWLLLFRTRLEHLSGPLRLPVLLLLLGGWLLGWYWSYYAVLGWLLPEQINPFVRRWDVYIPALFGGLQLGLLQLLRYEEQLRHRQQQSLQLQQRARESELAALKAQLNPHFLFNTLNSISASVPPELEHTRELIARLAHTFRFVLDASRHPVLPLRAELAFLRSYLELEQARFGARLRVEFAVEEVLLPVPLPPMLLQPLVENAVLHGIGPQVAGGTVRVRVQAAGAGLRVEVEDTGRGLPPGRSGAQVLAEATGVGLRNTHARLLALGSAGLELTPLPPQGLRVAFTLPLSPGEAPTALGSRASVASTQPVPGVAAGAPY